jgi:hypothetical protein
MKPLGDRVRRSNDRSGSFQRKPSPVTKVPANYRPPHLRNNFVGGSQGGVNRVSPGVRNGVQGTQ